MSSEQLWCLVTGSSRGIGREIAIHLAEEGYNIVLHCVQSRDKAEEVAEQIEVLGQSSRILQFDVNDREAATAILEEDMETHEAYYGVVLNAGISIDAAFPMLSGDDWDQVLQTNLNGFYNVMSPITMPMIRRRKPGRIITVSSVSGLIGNRGQVNYSAAKAGVIGATKALALELASRKITVNCVAPGLIETDMTDDLPMEEMLKFIPAGRAGKPREVSSAVAFLMGEDAAYITRQVISMNGGLA